LEIAIVVSGIIIVGIVSVTVKVGCSGDSVITGCRLFRSKAVVVGIIISGVVSSTGSVVGITVGEVIYDEFNENPFVSAVAAVPAIIRKIKEKIRIL